MRVLFLRLNMLYGQLLKGLAHFFLFVRFYILTALFHAYDAVVIMPKMCTHISSRRRQFLGPKCSINLPLLITVL